MTADRLVRTGLGIAKGPLGGLPHSVNVMTDTRQISEPSAAVATAVIRTQRLSKTFSHKGAQQHILKNLDLDILTGDFTVIMGPSGAGKSTLLYALSGMDTPSLGTVRFGDKEISSLTQDQLARFRRRNCGFVFQQINLLDSMSVMDNVLAPGLLTTSDRKGLRARAAELFALVGLPETAWRKFPAMLSGGEAQRVGLVRALINAPLVMFADEPTGQLSSQVGQRVLDLMTDINAGGQTTVMVTHDLRSALRGNRIVYLRDGVIQGELDLGAYQPDEDVRHRRLVGFLTEMGW